MFIITIAGKGVGTCPLSRRLEEPDKELKHNNSKKAAQDASAIASFVCQRASRVVAEII